MCSDDDFDQPSFYALSTPVARRPHRCCECRTTIPTGERYEKAVGKWDGEVGTYRTHAACAALWDFVHHVACGGHGHIVHGGLAEELAEADSYLDLDRYAWEEAGWDVPPRPLTAVFEEIQAHYEALT